MQAMLDVFGSTHVGLVRSGNEDALLAGKLVSLDGELQIAPELATEMFQSCGLLCAVADGMGGHTEGQLASLLTLNALAESYPSWLERSPDAERFVSELRTLLTAIHIRLMDRGDLGCTLVGVYMSPQYNVLVSAGDSRVYRYRQGMLVQLTRDDAVETVRGRAVTNSIGGGRGADFNLMIDCGLSVEAGDRLLLCSDGLCNVLEHKQLKRAIEIAGSSQEAARTLVNDALGFGAEDNISALVISVLETNCV